MSVEIFEVEQNSAEWSKLRLGIPTASMFSSILAKGEGKMRKTYLYKLAGERLTGEPADNYTNSHMERGHAMEDEARKAYAFMQDADPRRIGFVRNVDRGASPDSLIDDVGLIEIKTKLAHLQLELLNTDEMPSEHRAQVQGQLWVAEREWCDFVSYWPRLPLFVKRIYRDEAYIKTLADQVARFNDDLAALTEKMIRRGAQLHTAVAVTHDPEAAARGAPPSPPPNLAPAALPF